MQDDKIIVLSLNMCAYVLMKTNMNYELAINEKNHKGHFCFVFDCTDEVQNAMNEFRNSDCIVNIHDFLNQYKKIKLDISNKREKRS